VLSAKSLFGIFLVVAAAALGWLVLGSTLVVRTEQSDSRQRAALGGLWGTQLEQLQPNFRVFVDDPNPKKKLAWDVPPAASRIGVDLALDLRRKGLLWYNTYSVSFTGTYRVQNPHPRGSLRLSFPLPSDAGTYDDVAVFADGRTLAAQSGDGRLIADLPIAPGRTGTVTIRYRTRGLDRWTYRFGSAVTAVRDVELTMNTNFKGIDFPPRTLAPTAEHPTGAGWKLVWTYRQLVTGAGIGMAFPLPLQPGPLAERITFWAPLSLIFYVFVMLVITTLRRIDLHPVNYLFLAAAFFAFHLLFAYTVDRIPVEYAFVLCAVVSMALTVSYLRLVVGLRFAAVEAAAAQFFYLILFSLALFDEGYSGLSITVGAIVTLFVTMQLTGRIRWSERFAKK
jgi:hypothetical protein